MVGTESVHGLGGLMFSIFAALRPEKLALPLLLPLYAIAKAVMLPAIPLVMVKSPFVGFIMVSIALVYVIGPAVCRNDAHLSMPACVIVPLPV